ncbi:MAG: hypothetical protein OEW00_09440, partial [candidate division Zixibacteria bacterium]|nr:hypothetical protein [candidate division Zixibacteria bacterium]
LLLPPKDITTAIPELSRLAEAVSVTEGLDLPSRVTPTHVYARLLRGRRITDTLAGRFDLKGRYDAATSFEVHEALMAHSDFRVTEEGLLTIEVEDRDPQVAADLANAFVGELERVNREIVSNRARSNRQFLEERLAQVKQELDSAREQLQAFQMEHRAIDFDQQTRLAVEQAISLKVRLAEVDLNLRMKEPKLGRDNAELQELRRRHEILVGQIQQLEQVNPDSSFFSLPIASMPALKGQYEVFYSRVRVNESLYNLLLKELEQAKIQENDHSATITILEEARPPELRSRPQRAFIVVSTFVLSLIISVLLAACLEYLAHLKEQRPDDYRRALLFVNAFLGWLPGIKKTK